MRITKITLLLACVALSGCYQRIAEYNPQTGVWRFKSNSLATDLRADRIEIKTPTGIEIAIDKAMQDNDSLTLRFNPITKQIEVVTESGE